MSSLSTLPKGDSAWLLRKSIQRIMQQVSVLETNIGSSTTGNSADTQVIFNDAGTLRGDTGLTYDKSADRLSFGAGICYGLLTSASATITGDLTVDTSTLKVDSANNRVGILTATPTAALDVAGLVNISSATGGNYGLTINNTTNNAPAFLKMSGTGAGGGAELDFYNGATAWGGIKCTASSQLEFLSNSFSTLMTLNATGLGVGEAPVFGQKLTVNGNGSVRNGNKFNLWDTGNSTAHGIYNSGDNLTFYKNNGTTSMLLDSVGNLGIGVTPSAGKGCLQLSSGINFPATQVASSDANTLDDYEEGTWTGTLTFSTTPQTSNNSFTGRYTKVGRLVSVQGYLLIAPGGFVKGPASGGLQLTGLPFAVQTLSTIYQDLAAALADINSGSLCFTSVGAGSTTFAFESVGVVGAVVQRNAAPISAANFAATNAGFISLTFNFTYTT